MVCCGWVLYFGIIDFNVGSFSGLNDCCDDIVCDEDVEDNFWWYGSVLLIIDVD